MMPRMQSDIGLGKAVTLAALFPAMLALGLWLLGVPLDWSNWKTYAGLIIISFAVAIA